MKANPGKSVAALALFLCLMPAMIQAQARLEAERLVLFGFNRASIVDAQSIIPAGEFRLIGRTWDDSARTLYSESRPVSGSAVDVVFYLDPTIRDCLIEYGPKGKNAPVLISFAGYGLGPSLEGDDDIASLPSPPTRLKSPGGFAARDPHERLEFRDSGLGEVSRVFIAACTARAESLPLLLVAFSGLVGAALGLFILSRGRPTLLPSLVAGALILGLVLSIAASLPEGGMLFTLPLGGYTRDMRVHGLFRRTGTSTVSGRTAVFFRDELQVPEAGSSAEPTRVEKGKPRSIAALGLWGPGGRLVPFDSLVATEGSNSGVYPYRYRFSSIPEIRKVDGSLYLRPEGFIAGWMLR